MTVNFYGSNLLESHGEVFSLDLLGLEAITGLAQCLCGNQGENSFPVGNLLCDFADLW
jgi:hypothetical protein